MIRCGNVQFLVLGRQIHTCGPANSREFHASRLWAPEIDQSKLLTSDNPPARRPDLGRAEGLPFSLASARLRLPSPREVKSRPQPDASIIWPKQLAGISEKLPGRRRETGAQPAAVFATQGIVGTVRGPRCC